MAHLDYRATEFGRNPILCTTSYDACAELQGSARTTFRTGLAHHSDDKIGRVVDARRRAALADDSPMLMSLDSYVSWMKIIDDISTALSPVSC